jgi:hypothetical protein
MTAYQLGTVFGSIIGPLLVFGTLLYMIKRGKLSFYEAVQNRWVVGWTVLTILANAVPRPVTNPTPALGLRVFKN